LIASKEAMKQSNPQHAGQPAFLFDLDGTLIDSVYEHTLAWREALEKMRIELPTASIHRRIGMSGGLLVKAFEREAGTKFSAAQVEHMQKLHSAAYKKRANQVRPLPGARDLLRELSHLRVPWAIATSGKLKDANTSLKMLKLTAKIPIITRDDVEHAKPEPDLFLAAAHKLGAEMTKCVVVGDSVWDLLAAQRAHALGVGLLSGGFGENELESAGAYRVYRDPADLLAHLDEVGVRGA
jgi:HAD superfamily hydrolase (TIGR01509 family)